MGETKEIEMDWIFVVLLVVGIMAISLCFYMMHLEQKWTKESMRAGDPRPAFAGGVTSVDSQPEVPNVSQEKEQNP